MIADDDDDYEENEDEESPSDAKDEQSLSRSQRCEVQIMYIQMEFCEKSTLRYIITHTHQCLNVFGFLLE